MSPVRRVCLVTSETGDPGAAEPGETAMSTLAREAALAGADVTLLHFGDPTSPALAKLRCEHGVRIEHFAYNAGPITPAHMRQTTEIFRYLSAHDFDVIVFQDRYAFGHASMVAKACGIAFESTTLAVVAYGSLGWLRESSRMFPREMSDIVLEYMERRTVELADAIISPSTAVTDWMMQAGWLLPPETVAWPKPSDQSATDADRWRRAFDRLATIPPRPAPAITAHDVPDTTVIVTHWEQPKLLNQNLQALAAQTDKSFEVIVIDDGSQSGDALRYLDTIEDRYRGMNVKLVRQANRYLGAARNTAIRMAKTEFIILLDDDNVAFPEMVRTFRLAAHSSGADVITCAIKHFSDLDGEPDPASHAENRETVFSAGPLLAGAADNCFGDATGIYRRKIFDRVGGFHEQFGVGFEDWQMHMRVVSAGGRLLSLPLPLLWYRIRPDSMLRRTSGYMNARVIVSAVDQMPCSALAPLAGYLIGSNAELSGRGAEIERLSQSNAELTQTLAERDRSIGELTQILAEHSRSIGGLTQVLAERDRSIGEFTQILAERDRSIGELTQILAERNRLIVVNDGLTVDLQKRDDLIRAIYSSRSWKLTRIVRVFGRFKRRISIERIKH